MKVTKQEYLNKQIDLCLNRQIRQGAISKLEKNVWQGIKRQKFGNVQSGLYDILIVLGLPKFRIGSMGLAIIMGLLFSSVMSSSLDRTGYDRDSEIVEMAIFDEQSPYLLTSILVLDK